MGHTMHATGLIKVPVLAEHHSRRIVYTVFVFLASALSIGAITAVACWSDHPLVVPSLGPTAFLVFNRCQSSVARPRNIVFGHLIGALAGYLSLVVFGLQHAPSVVEGGLVPPRIGAAALSIALTSAVMILLHAEHGPAGATTLIVSLGFMTTPSSLSLLMAGVIFLAALGVLIDRSVGLQLPFWSGRAAKRPTKALGPYLAPLPSLPRDEFEGDGKPTALHREVESRPRLTVQPLSWMIGPGEGRKVTVGSDECTVKVQDAQASGSYSVLEVVFDPNMPSTLLHAHYSFSETYFVLEGEVIAEIGTDRRRARAGSTISVPAGIPHVLSAAGGRPAHCLCITERAHHSDLEYLP